ncbi:hypothetical protein QWT69_13940 [Sporosarcina oncorhynchi]|uniref:Uncharacterized protein n=1 Tax=Sporosarcina oncorhynchi TaxID=3056444 RepID=A0ABZ0L470_9BACL|nr:hypothetical protein [Sporosarcina sp. T2O-4]WOV86960.1 hypothetical protein QWT69_13940 [Sporosarcina sp. T2O-4]
MSYWQFSPIPNIEESNFNKILERFYNLKVAGLIRENIQNSLDGRLLDSEDPVKFSITTGTIQKKDVPGINEVIKRIHSLKGRNSYTKEAIEHMVKTSEEEEVHYISFEDSNTRGLSGAKNGQSNSSKDTWAIYAYNKGVHSEEEDAAVETSRGGSHGVGKIASNAASDLNVMYFANCDANGDQHLGGTVQLIEHEFEGQSYRSTGYFADIERLGPNKSKFYPFENTFHKVFEKKTRGLKIIIPFLRKEYSDETDIIRSVCDSFFVSILLNKLEVDVNGRKIDANNIQEYVNDPEYYTQNIADMKHVFTPLYVSTYLEQPARTLHVSDGKEEYEFNLYFRYDEEIPKGRVAIIRTIGMKIEDKKVKNKANQPFNAVLIGGAKEDAYLKSLENESHTELTDDHIKDPVLQKRAKRFINNLSRAMTTVIDEAIKDHNPTDGKMDTKDLLYVSEVQFKQELSKAMGAVVIDKKKPVVKMDDDLPPRKGKKKPGGSSKPTNPPLIKPVKRTTSADDTDTNDDKPLSIFNIHPNTVERLLMGNKEIVRFNLSSNEEVKKASTCNVSISIIDGMGQEYRSAFKLKDNFSQVIDKSTGSTCSLNNNKINHVTINEGVAELTFDLKNNYNRALKFVYYVEV